MIRPKHPPSEPGIFSRRRFMKASLGAAGAIGALAMSLVETTKVSAEASDSAVRGPQGHHNLHHSLDRAYRFLNSMMDGYAQGSAIRLIQSYADQQGLNSTGFTYDNALAIIAYLERGKKDDIARAKVLGNGLLYAQQHDPNYQDGRLRQAYFVDEFVLPDGFVKLAGDPFWFVGSAVGDMAWAALALARLAYYTRDSRYLNGALALGNWIFDKTYDTKGPGGYNFGVDAGNNLLLFKSSEHNIDVYGLFSILARLTKQQIWTTRAQHALNFIKAMWNPSGGFFWTGTTPDGITTNFHPIPEDVQSWSYLALLDRSYAASLDWAKANLATTDTAQSPNASFSGNLSFSGVTFSNASLTADPNTQPNPWTPKPDPRAVWFEGTAQMVAALHARGARGDARAIEAYINSIQDAQDSLGQGQTVAGKPLANGNGIVAASSVLDTGFGFSYFPNLHIGATAWYCIGAQGSNPYTLPRGHGHGRDE